jgi:hypothetical protein
MRGIDCAYCQSMKTSPFFCCKMLVSKLKMLKKLLFCIKKCQIWHSLMNFEGKGLVFTFRQYAKSNSSIKILPKRLIFRKFFFGSRTLSFWPPNPSSTQYFKGTLKTILPFNYIYTPSRTTQLRKYFFWAQNNFFCAQYFFLSTKYFFAHKYSFWRRSILFCAQVFFFEHKVFFAHKLYLYMCITNVLKIFRP